MEQGTISSVPNSEGICVAIRMRPLNERENSGGQEAAYRCTARDNKISQLKDGQVMDGQTYFYDRVFDESATTAEVYTHIGRDAVKNVAAGINGTIFACKKSLNLYLFPIYKMIELTSNMFIYLKYVYFLRWPNKFGKNPYYAWWRRSKRSSRNGC